MGDKDQPKLPDDDEIWRTIAQTEIDDRWTARRVATIVLIAVALTALFWGGAVLLQYLAAHGYVRF